MPTKKLRTFGFTSCRSILAKLGREISRLETAKTLENATDHGTNAAVTAWHLVDWIWNASKQNRQILNQITVDAARGQLGHTEFKQWLCENPGCPRLKICQMITTSYKHSAELEGDPDFDLHPEWAEVHFTDTKGEEITFTDAKGEKITWVNATRWLIVEGTNQYPALELFQEVHKFWNLFLDRYGIL